jgi:predicted  nucleic acid-binding Zn-ribbon protein
MKKCEKCGHDRFKTDGKNSKGVIAACRKCGMRKYPE